MWSPQTGLDERQPVCGAWARSAKEVATAVVTLTAQVQTPVLQRAKMFHARSSTIHFYRRAIGRVQRWD